MIKQSKVVLIAAISLVFLGFSHVSADTSASFETEFSEFNNAGSVQKSASYEIFDTFPTLADQVTKSSSFAVYEGGPGQYASSLPTCTSFAASPSSITAGGSSTLSWTTQDAISGSMDNGVGAIAIPGGSTVVSPVVTTTYVITLVRGEFSNSCTTTLTVGAPPLPLCTSFLATPTVVTTGASSILSWSVTGADSAVIDNGIGAIALPSSTVSVSPTTTTTYKLTATNTSGTDECSTLVTVVAGGGGGGGSGGSGGGGGGSGVGGCIGAGCTPDASGGGVIPPETTASEPIGGTEDEDAEDEPDEELTLEDFPPVQIDEPSEPSTEELIDDFAESLSELLEPVVPLESIMADIMVDFSKPGRTVAPDTRRPGDKDIPAELVEKHTAEKTPTIADEDAGSELFLTAEDFSADKIADTIVRISHRIYLRWPLVLMILLLLYIIIRQRSKISYFESELNLLKRKVARKRKSPSRKKSTSKTKRKK